MLILPMLAFMAPVASAHLTIWHPAMFAWNGPPGCTADTQLVDGSCGRLQAWPVGVQPFLTAGLTSISDWWFRGTNYTGPDQIPDASQVVELPAGGTTTLEIACHKSYTSFGRNTTVPGSYLDACPGTPSSYHAMQGNDSTINAVQPALIGTCALAIYDGEDWKGANMTNMVIFSIQTECVKQKNTDFAIPANMPPCTGSHCICAWFWLPKANGANWYMTGFNCDVTGGSLTHQIATPRDPVDCSTNPALCVAGAKNPLYVYNSPSNVAGAGLTSKIRPTYEASWSFNISGAQTDIFETVPARNLSVIRPSYTTTAASSKATGVGQYGAQCINDEGCASGYCRNGVCQISTTAGPKIANPGHCHIDYNCVTNSACYGDGSGSTDSLFCALANTTLTAKTCSTAADCPAGFNGWSIGCRSGHCYRQKLLFDPCTLDSDCASGVCDVTSGTCSASSSSLTPSSSAFSSTSASPSASSSSTTVKTTTVPSTTMTTSSTTVKTSTTTSASATTTRKALYAVCAKDADCASSYCVNSKCADGTIKGPRIAVPGHCHIDYDCGAAALCFGNGLPNNSDSFVCVRTNSTVVATKCTSDSNCPTLAGCRSGLCHPYKQLYDPCTINSDCQSATCDPTALICLPSTQSTTATPRATVPIANAATPAATSKKSSTTSTLRVTRRY